MIRNEIRKEEITDTHVVTTYWTDCYYCEATGGIDRCGCSMCCICKGKKGRLTKSKNERYRCVGGPLDGQLESEPRAKDYFRYNCSVYGHDWGANGSEPLPKCLLIHKSLVIEGAL